MTGGAGGSLLPQPTRKAEMVIRKIALKWFMFLRSYVGMNESMSKGKATPELGVAFGLPLILLTAFRKVVRHC